MDQTRQNSTCRKPPFPNPWFSLVSNVPIIQGFWVSNFVYFDWYPCVRDIGHPNGRPQKSIQQPSTWPSQTRRPRAIQEDFRSSSSLALIWVRMEPWNYIFCTAFPVFLPSEASKHIFKLFNLLRYTILSHTQWYCNVQACISKAWLSMLGSAWKSCEFQLHVHIYIYV